MEKEEAAFIVSNETIPRLEAIFLWNHRQKRCLGPWEEGPCSTGACIYCDESPSCPPNGHVGNYPGDCTLRKGVLCRHFKDCWI